MDEKKLHHNNSYSKDVSSKKDFSENKEKDTAAKRTKEQESGRKTAVSCGCGCE